MIRTESTVQALCCQTRKSEVHYSDLFRKEKFRAKVLSPRAHEVSSLEANDVLDEDLSTLPETDMGNQDGAFQNEEARKTSCSQYSVAKFAWKLHVWFLSLTWPQYAPIRNASAKPLVQSTRTHVCSKRNTDCVFEKALASCNLDFRWFSSEVIYNWHLSLA